MPQDFERQDHESDARAYGRYDLDEGEGEDILLKPVVGSARRNDHKIFPQPRGTRSILPDNLRPRFCGIQAQSCRTRVERIARAAEARLRAPRRGGHEDPSPTKATITCDFSFEQIGFDEPCNLAAGGRQFLIASCLLRVVAGILAVRQIASGGAGNSGGNHHA